MSERRPSVHPRPSQERPNNLSLNLPIPSRTLTTNVDGHGMPISNATPIEHLLARCSNNCIGRTILTPMPLTKLILMIRTARFMPNITSNSSSTALPLQVKCPLQRYAIRTDPRHSLSTSPITPYLGAEQRRDISSRPVSTMKV